MWFIIGIVVGAVAGLIVCSVCGLSPLSKEEKERWEQQYEELKKEYSKLSIAKNVLEEECGKTTRMLEEFRNNLEVAKAAYDKQRALVAELESRVRGEQASYERLKNVVAEYEKDVVSAKVRILKNYRYERERGMRLIDEELVGERTRLEKEIERVRESLEALSRIDRLAYEEKASRDEVLQRNRLSLDESVIMEVKELYQACESLRLANPLPLYKAIYELYLKGPVKELGVRCGAGCAGIYKITNCVNGKVYVGQSVNIAERWRQHIRKGCKCDVGANEMYADMWKYGVWNFSFQVLEKVDENLNEHESMWIKRFQSDEIGYNRRG